GMVFNLSPEALLAVSGTVAVTLGFAFKDVAASFLAGISILTNKPFQVGDRISFGGYYGEVKEIGLRTVRLVTLDDNLVTIPSNKFLTDPVASANAGELDCMVVMNFFVDAGADHARAQEIVRQAVLASKYLYLGKPLAVLLSNRVSEHGRLIVELTAKAYVYDTRHEKAFASDVTDRVLRAFKRDGVALPGFLPTPS
ncbi:MAG: mechanosensitive ion channel domain-containing protein, partial [Myxococcota bacterium]